MELARDFAESDYLRRLKQDDERAFDALFRHYSALVYRFAYSYLKSRPAAEEIVQECFIKIWEKRAQLRDDLPLKGYLFTTAHHAVLNELRRDQHHLRLHGQVAAAAGPASVANEVEYQEMEALYQAALERLPPKQREAFLLSRQQGLSYPEIAERQGVSVKTVEAHMMQALKTMRSYFRLHGGGILGLLLTLAVGSR
ncbi:MULTISPECIES: RNA polymerase sigma-70 factor [Hymenobacter]|uniref:RNA polymerase sigma-70 factor n=1 Tax=Hymenobacter setariae TaxID=2594794 RepID=A0A558BV12_9BACT|nr:RNA polymerase sigma-70 factor [Hymenobacter setariae]MBJ6143204.1 RNA polymerase sigma-70 factor [Hymenobacter sp. BT559]TVT40366.1 RNA polymerase sigma-70 factor [Hymenobacter setariae]